MQALMAFVFGSMVGSFLNVCILRMPKDESIAFPGSHCTSCQKPIAWYDNIPILSFLILRARCRHCRAVISWQYPLIEALTGALFVLFLHRFGVSPKGILFLYLALVLLAQGVIDFRYRIIPDLLTLPAIVAALAMSAAFPDIHAQASHLGGLWVSLKGVLLGGGFLYVVGTVAEWILKKEAMGGGDVKLLAAIGGVIGWRGVVWTIFVSALIGSLIGVYDKYVRKGDGYIPYGPFLGLAAFLFMFVGPQTIQWYIGHLQGI